MGSIFDPDRILVRRSGMLGRIIDPINHFSIFLYPPMLVGQVAQLGITAELAEFAQLFLSDEWD